MVGTSATRITMVLVISCMATLVMSSRLAPWAPQPKYLIPIPGMSPMSYESDDILQHCWSSLESTQGCVMEIYRSLTGGQASLVVGSACCQAISRVNDDCWPRMFPLDPLFPNMLKNYCAAPAPNGIGQGPLPRNTYN